jgi:4-amino-4-deoxy-L-arabinose transferase-like glycosyltransferase
MAISSEHSKPEVVNTKADPERGFFDSHPWLRAGAICALVVLGLGLRLINLTNPPLDYHADRQLHSAIIARGIYCQMTACGDESFRQTAIALWKGETVYEPQILERLVALTYILIGNETLWVIRILNAIFWLVGGAALFILARWMTSTDGAITALALYAILDFFVLINRAFLPETFMLMWTILASLALYRWMATHRWKWAILAGILSGVAILVKVVAVFPILCMLLLLVLANNQYKLKRIFSDPQVWFMGLVTVFIPSLYYLISIGPRSSGFFEFWTLSFIRLLFQPSFYLAWLSFIHGLVGLSLLGLGLCGSFYLPRLGRAVAWGWWLGYLLYGLFLPHQVSTHDYYNIFLVPMLALSLAGLAKIFFTKLNSQPTFSQVLVLGIALTGILYSAWLTRNTIMASNMRQEITAWKRMGEELPIDGEVVALTQDYGNRLRYYGNRSFILWPYSWDFDLTLKRGGNVGSFQENFNQYTTNAKYFLVSYFSELDVQGELKRMLYDHYPLIKQGDGYILFDLSQRINPTP